MHNYCMQNYKSSYKRPRLTFVRSVISPTSGVRQRLHHPTDVLRCEDKRIFISKNFEAQYIKVIKSTYRYMQN